MKTHYLFFSIFILLILTERSSSFILTSLVLGASAAGLYTIRCKFYECCDNQYIIRNTMQLKNDLEKKLYGQQIARDIIYSAVNSHVHHAHPRKALVLSFHGLPGSGKNYVVTMIANSLFKRGEKSSHYYFFNGRADFPSDSPSLVALYKFNLKEKVERALSNCERSLFVFDEVDKMPTGVLDVLVPFLDYTSYSDRNKSKAIFIFLSNTGSKQIVQRMLALWEDGKNRNEATLQDFESLISIGAFNEEGGLHRSGTIESKLIDHHVPFLPMEKDQVVQCIMDVFKHWGVSNPTKSMIDEALTHVSYGPHPHNIYSTSGCKKLDYKISYILRKKKFSE